MPARTARELCRSFAGLTARDGFHPQSKLVLHGLGEGEIKLLVS